MYLEASLVHITGKSRLTVTRDKANLRDYGSDTIDAGARIREFGAERAV